MLLYMSPTLWICKIECDSHWDNRMSGGLQVHCCSLEPQIRNYSIKLEVSTITEVGLPSKPYTLQGDSEFCRRIWSSFCATFDVRIWLLTSFSRIDESNSPSPFTYSTPLMKLNRLVCFGVNKTFERSVQASMHSSMVIRSLPSMIAMMLRNITSTRFQRLEASRTRQYLCLQSSQSIAMAPEAPFLQQSSFCWHFSWYDPRWG